jgi:hypothetical protein
MNPGRFAKPSPLRSARRAVTGWLLIAFGIWMAFSTATTTTDHGLRLSMLVAIGLLSIVLLVDVTIWSVRRHRRPAHG